MCILLTLILSYILVKVLHSLSLPPTPTPHCPIPANICLGEDLLETS